MSPSPPCARLQTPPDSECPEPPEIAPQSPQPASPDAPRQLFQTQTAPSPEPPTANPTKPLNRLVGEGEFPLTENPKNPLERVVEFVDDSFFERNDGVVGDFDFFGAYLGAAFGDVAVADAAGIAEVADAVGGVERVHLHRGGVDEKTRADELVVHVVFAEDVADVLAQIALDAFAEFLDAVDVGLR